MRLGWFTYESTREVLRVEDFDRLRRVAFREGKGEEEKEENGLHVFNNMFWVY